MGLIERWIAARFAEVIRKGGKLVSNEQHENRISVCSTCEYKGVVRPLPLIKLPGCLKCGCPFATKPKMYNYFSISEMRIKIAECPHEDGNKWKEIDKDFVHL